MVVLSLQYVLPSSRWPFVNHSTLFLGDVWLPLFWGDQILTVLDVRNFALSLSEIRIIREYLCIWDFNVKAFPNLQFGILVGDLNIKAEHARSFRIGKENGCKLKDRGFSDPVFSG